MPRGGRSSGGSRGSPFGSRPASAPAPAPRSAPAPVSKPATPAANKSAPAPAPASPAPAASGGPGLFGIMASSAAGSVAGHYLANSLFGGSNGEGASVPPQTQQAIDSEYGACAPSFKTFLSCVQANEHDIANCQWAYGAFTSCAKNTEQL